MRRRPAIRIGAAVRGTKRIQLPSKTSIDQGQESSRQRDVGLEAAHRVLEEKGREHASDGKSELRERSR